MNRTQAIVLLLLAATASACSRTGDNASVVRSDEGVDLESHVDQVRKRLIMEALARTAGRQAEAAAQLSISVRSLRYYVKKYGLRPSTYHSMPERE